MADASLLKGGDILGAMGLKGFRFGLGTIGTVAIWILLSLMVFGLILAVILWIYFKKVYNQQSWILGNVGGKSMLKLVDKGRYIRFGMAGDKLFRLRKSKKYLSPPTIQTGKNLWLFWERKDGELINIGLGDVDEQMRLAGAYFVDTDMRMQRLGIEKNLRDRLMKESWFSKYGSTIAGVIFVILVTVALVVLFSKLVDVAGAMDKMAGSVKEMADVVEKYYSVRVGGQAPSDIINGGGGLVPAG